MEYIYETLTWLLAAIVLILAFIAGILHSILMELKRNNDNTFGKNDELIRDDQEIRGI